MRRTFTLLLFLFPFILSAQTSDCDGIRYLSEQFPTYDLTTVQYGSNSNPQGQTQNLLVDVYEPSDDTQEKRPLIIWCYGGAFIGGDRQQMQPYCEFTTERGYVSAAIDYRLWNITAQGFPDSLDLLDVAVKAMGDLKAAIRFFRQDAATTNQFRIDPDRILIGGLSAGAITALHAAYVDEEDTLPDYFQDIVDANGGLEGNTGDVANQGYSSEVHGVINLSGALHRDVWLDAGEPPLISFHGTADEVVPYEFGNAMVFNFTYMTLYGSGALHTRAEAEGIPHLLVSVPGGGHDDIHLLPQYEPNRIDFFVNGLLLMFDEVICPSLVSTEEISPDLAFEVFPNPAIDQVQIRWEPNGLNVQRIQMMDMMGRVLPLSANVEQGQIEIYRNGIASGLYVLNLIGEKGQLLASKKLLFD